MADAEDTLLELSGLPRRRPGQRLGDLPNPLSVFGRGIDRVTTPGYAVDDALLRWRGEAPIFKATLGEAVKGAGVNLVKPMAAFAGGLRDRDYRAVMESSLLPMAGMTVYHGSPHWFDAFDLKKVGTGEGAQAYGHGLYFAENKGVAKGYMAAGQVAGPQKSTELFGSHGPIDVGGLLYDLPAKTRNKLAKMDSSELKGWLREKLSDDINFWSQSPASDAGVVVKKFKSMLDNVEAAESLAVRLNTGKNLYHVDIPDEHIAKMLDWDKPLSEQAEGVRTALQSRFRIVNELDSDGPWVAYFGDQSLDSAKTRKALVEKFESNPAAMLTAEGGKTRGERQAMSDLLKTLGIPGIKYLDAGSRTTKEGTRNIVLFDEKLAKIIKRE